MAEYSQLHVAKLEGKRTESDRHVPLLEKRFLSLQEQLAQQVTDLRDMKSKLSKQQDERIWELGMKLGTQLGSWRQGENIPMALHSLPHLVNAAEEALRIAVPASRGTPLG